MDFDQFIEWVTKLAGLLDIMFFIAYSIVRFIDWVNEKRK